MRIQVLEDRNCFLTRLKYYMESAAHAQERFDHCRRRWEGTDPHGFCHEEIYPARRGDFYIIQAATGMIPMPPPVWFAKGKLRPDQTDWLEKIIEAREKQKQAGH